MGGFVESDQGDYGIDLRNELARLWRMRWYLVVCGILGAGAGMVGVKLSPPTYEASVVMAPASGPEGAGGLGSLPSGISGLAAMAGLSLGGDGLRKAEAVAILQSDGLTADYIQQQGLLPVLFAEKWDERAQAWRVKGSEVPTVWKGIQAFKKVRSVSTNAKTGLITLVVRWRDPGIAARWANDLVAGVNARMKASAIIEAERNIAYLTDAAKSTSIVEGRQAIYSLLESEINKAMLAKGSDEFALRVIDSAMVPEKPRSAGVLMWLAAGGFVGLMIGFFIGLVRMR